MMDIRTKERRDARVFLNLDVRYVSIEAAQKTHHSPFEDVLRDVSRLWGVPLNRVGVGLVS